MVHMMDRGSPGAPVGDVGGNLGNPGEPGIQILRKSETSSNGLSYQVSVSPSTQYPIIVGPGGSVIFLGILSDKYSYI